MSLTSIILNAVNQSVGDDDDDSNVTDLLVEAEEGNPDAQFECGLMLILGMGLRQDVAVGLNFLVEAAMAGHSTARAEVESCYFFGANMACADTKEWLALSSRQDDQGTFDYYLGYFHYRGILVEKSYEQAVICLKRAAKLGNMAALLQLGRFDLR